MTRDELQQAAINYLGNAFNGHHVVAHTLQAAVSLVLSSDSGTTTPTTPPVVPPVVPPIDPTPISRPLPAGYDSDVNVAFNMLTVAMDAHGLTPTGVQGHGSQIADALNATWPGLNAYADKRSDAVMWPGFGDLDVTIDSGKGGWSFQPGHNTPYEPDPAKR
jgi:hypothetical protein